MPSVWVLVADVIASWFYYGSLDLPTFAAYLFQIKTSLMQIVGHWGYRSYREHLAEQFPGQRIRKLAECWDDLSEPGRNGKSRGLQIL